MKYKEITEKIYNSINLYPKVLESIEKRYSITEVYKYKVIKIDISLDIFDGKIPNYDFDFMESETLEMSKMLPKNERYGVGEFYFEVFHSRGNSFETIRTLTSPPQEARFYYEEGINIWDPCYQDPLTYTSKWYSFNDLLKFISSFVLVKDFSVYDYDFTLKTVDDSFLLELTNKS